jgi:hypothetical protein
MSEGEKWRLPLCDIRSSAMGDSPRPDILRVKYKDLRLSAGDLVRLFAEVSKINSDEGFRFDPLELLRRVLERRRDRNPNGLEHRIMLCLSNGFPVSGESSGLEIVIEALKSGKDQGLLDELITATWMAEDPSATLEFPVASVLLGKGMITTMRLRVWKNRRHGILPDFMHYDRAIAKNLAESAEFARRLSGETGLVSWSIPELEAEACRGDGKLPEIAGPSRSAAIARALWLHKNGKKIDPRLLVIGEVDKEGRLAKVGEIKEKTEAAIDYTGKAISEGRTPIDRIAIVGSEEAAVARNVIAGNQANDLIDVVELDPESLIPQSVGV